MDTTIVSTIQLDSLYSVSPWIEWRLKDYFPKTSRLIKGVLVSNDSVSILQIKFEDEYMSFGLFRKIQGPGFRKYFIRNQKNLLFLKNGRDVNVLQLKKNEVWKKRMIHSFMFLSDSTEIVPNIFNSFPQQSRISNSEFVVPQDYLGVSEIGAVIGAQYPCYFDTLTLFRSFWNQEQIAFEKTISTFDEPEKLKITKKSYEYSGITDLGVPIFLVGNELGLIGQIGCFEPILARKMVGKAGDLNALFRQNP